MRWSPNGAAAAALLAGLANMNSALAQDLNKFESNLKAGLNGKATGYQYAIYEGQTLKKSGGSGFANIASQVSMNPDRKMMVASMSKTITAAGVMKALEILQSKGQAVTIDSKVAPYLPSGWVPGPHMKELTIRDLLRHLSGFRGPGDDGSFDGLRVAIATGSKDADWHQPQYRNANFAMFRVVIPYLLYPRKSIELPAVSQALQNEVKGLEAEIKDLQDQLKKAAPGEKPVLANQIKKLQSKLVQAKAKLGQHKSIEQRTAELYVQFVQTEVLGPVGLSSATIAPAPGDPMVYYNFNDPTKTWGGYQFDDALLHCGHNYWVLSAKEYGKFITGLQAGKIVSPPTFKKMRDDLLGMYIGMTPPFTATKGGSNWNHNGGVTVGNGAGVQGDWMILPNNISVVVLVNSQGGVAGLLEEIIRPCWNASW